MNSAVRTDNNFKRNLIFTARFSPHSKPDTKNQFNERSWLVKWGNLNHNVLIRANAVHVSVSLKPKAQLRGDCYFPLHKKEGAEERKMKVCVRVCVKNRKGGLGEAFSTPTTTYWCMLIDEDTLPVSM